MWRCAAYTRRRLPSLSVTALVYCCCYRPNLQAVNNYRQIAVPAPIEPITRRFFGYAPGRAVTLHLFANPAREIGGGVCHHDLMRDGNHGASKETKGQIGYPLVVI